MKKLFTILFLGIILLLPTAAAQAATCCVCNMYSAGESGIAGTRVFSDITDDTDGKCSVDKKTELTTGYMTYYVCSITENSECVAVEEAEPEMTTIAEEFGLKDVILGVTIPNLHFSAAPTEVDEEGNLYIPWAAEYLKAIYNFSVVAVSILAVVVLIISGAQVIMSSGGPAKAAAYKRITQAVIGVFIAWGSYIVLYTINPNLTNLSTLKIAYVNQDIYEFEANYIGTENDGSSAASNPELEAKAYEVAEKVGINGCLFATQIGKESGWKVSNSTGCCHGLGQIMLSNAKTMLKNKRDQIISYHSEGCPNCPQSSDSDEAIISWLNSDAEGNLILAAMIKKNALNGTSNPVASAAVYGMGLGSWKSYLKRTGCSAKSFSEDALLTMLNTKTVDEILEMSCIPPDTWPIANTKKNFDCPPNSSDTVTYCCKSATGVCERPAFSASGRLGYCQGGERDGQTCAAVAGGETYIRGYLKSIKKCAK
jgi:hypothetical protein